MATTNSTSTSLQGKFLVVSGDWFLETRDKWTHDKLTAMRLDTFQAALDIAHRNGLDAANVAPDTMIQTPLVSDQ